MTMMINFYRFVYYNPVCNTTQALNYSMNVANKLRIDEGLSNLNLNKITHSDKNNLLSRCAFKFDEPGSFDLYVCNKGGNKQKEYERVADVIINLIAKRFKFRVSKLVLDFVQDETRTIYLIGVPAFLIDPCDKVGYSILLL